MATTHRHRYRLDVCASAEHRWRHHHTLCIHTLRKPQTICLFACTQCQMVVELSGVLQPQTSPPAPLVQRLTGLESWAWVEGHAPFQFLSPEDIA